MNTKGNILILVAIFIVVAITGVFGFIWLQNRVALPFVAVNSDPNLERITLPDGFAINYYADAVEGARSMAVSESGIVYVGSRQAGNVYALVPNVSRTAADKVVIVASKLNQPNGVVWHEGDLYVAEVNRVIKFNDIDNMYDENPTFDIVRDDFPTDRSHGWKYLRIGPDNKLYVPVGAPCNICEESNAIYASITRMNLDGSDREIVAHGIRNSVGFDWHPQTQELWFTDNGRDWLGDDEPGDELNMVTEIGQHFGFPYCHNNDIIDPDYGNGVDCNEYVDPVQILGPHVAALGMRFYTGENFPEAYKNTVFIAEHGSWNRSEPIGYRVTTVSFDPNGGTTYSTFAEGWLENGDAWGRPVDILMLNDGSMLVSDDAAGAIYRITYNQ